MALSSEGTLHIVAPDFNLGKRLKNMALSSEGTVHIVAPDFNLGKRLKV